jgi:DnaJ-class molecular chaperone
MNPYFVLNVNADCTDADVRAAYLNAVREFTPEKHPERFSDIQAAYEKIKDERSRIRWFLFDTAMPAQSPFDALRLVVRSGARKPPRLDVLKEMMRTCANNR